jgi:hypothetical protein
MTSRHTGFLFFGFSGFVRLDRFDNVRAGPLRRLLHGGELAIASVPTNLHGEESFC